MMRAIQRLLWFPGAAEYLSKVSTFTMHDIQLLKISAGMAAVVLMSFAIFIRCSWKWGNDMQRQELAEEQLLLFWSLWTRSTSYNYINHVKSFTGYMCWVEPFSWEQR
jgi:hypothetical protein